MRSCLLYRSYLVVRPTKRSLQEENIQLPSRPLSLHQGGVYRCVPYWSFMVTWSYSAVQLVHPGCYLSPPRTKFFQDVWNRVWGSQQGSLYFKLTPLKLFNSNPVSTGGGTRVCIPEFVGVNYSYHWCHDDGTWRQWWSCPTTQSGLCAGEERREGGRERGKGLLFNW